MLRGHPHAELHLRGASSSLRPVGEGLADLIMPNTRLVWTEVPGSVSMEVPDIPALCRAAHGRGVLVAIDNTWSAGLAFKAFEHGVDIVMQAVTKYQSGGSDVLMGAVDFMLRIVTRDIEAYERFFFEKLSLVPGIQEVNSIVALSEIKSTTSLPLA